MGTGRQGKGGVRRYKWRAWQVSMGGHQGATDDDRHRLGHNDAERQQKV